MITEDYVSFETAKLLKEKGYKGSFDGYYNNAGCVVDKPNTLLKEPEYQYYERVSIYMAMKWLREVHKYLIVIGNKNGNYLYLIKYLKVNMDLGISNNEYIYYKEACEAAIEYCLENLI